MSEVSQKELKCVRYLTQEMSLEDRAVFELELSLDDELFTIYQKYKLIWNNYPVPNLPLQTNSLDKIFKNAPKLRNQKKCLTQKIALAISVVVLISFTTYYFSKPKITYTNCITTSIEDSKVIYLPDSTKVHLNSNSEIRYPNSFKNTRDVCVNGEAFFDVKHNKNKPFIVHTKELDIQVLGTAFNVNTQTENKTISLERGRVKVLLKNSGNELNLLPNEELVFNSNTKEITKRNFKIHNVLAWKNNMLILDNILIKDAILKINKFYGVTFYIENNRIANQRITGVFKNQDLNEFISSFEFIANISIQSTKPNEYQIKQNR